MQNLFCVVNPYGKILPVEVVDDTGLKEIHRYFSKKMEAKIWRDVNNSDFEGNPKDLGYRINVGPDHWRYQK